MCSWWLSLLDVCARRYQFEPRRFVPGLPVRNDNIVYQSRRRAAASLSGPISEPLKERSFLSHQYSNTSCSQSIGLNLNSQTNSRAVGLLGHTLSLNPMHEYSLADSRAPEGCPWFMLTADTPPRARPISPPVNTARELRYSCYVDYQSRIYQIYCTNWLRYPDLSRFPKFDGTSHAVTLSDTMANVWAASEFLNDGTDGCILIHSRS